MDYNSSKGKKGVFKTRYSISGNEYIYSLIKGLSRNESELIFQIPFEGGRLADYFKEQRSIDAPSSTLASGIKLTEINVTIGEWEKIPHL